MLRRRRGRGGVGRSESWEIRPGVRWNKAFFLGGGRGGEVGGRQDQGTHVPSSEKTQA